MRSTDGSGRDDIPLGVVSDITQTLKNNRHPFREQIPHILDENESRLDHLDDPKELKPQPRPRVIKTLPAPGSRYSLAWEPAYKNIRKAVSNDPRSYSPNIFDDRNIWKTLAQDSLAKLLILAHPDDLATEVPYSKFYHPDPRKEASDCPPLVDIRFLITLRLTTNTA
jgi:hypothetical protein